MGSAFRHCRGDRARRACVAPDPRSATCTRTRTFIRTHRAYCSAHAQRRAHSFLAAK